MSTVVTSRYQEVVEALMNLGVPREAAEARAREVAPPPPETAPERDARILEKAEQVEVVKNFQRAGFKVYSLSQARASKQTPGLFDLWCVNVKLGVALWWDVKRQVGGALSADQGVFRGECIECRIWQGVGDRYESARWLIQNGFARRDAAGNLIPAGAP